MLKDAGLESQSAEIKTWYDGYHFGDADIYCPWDVISYLRDFQYGVAQKPKSYWKNTSDNAIIRSFIDYAGDNITTKLETLMAGGSIIQHIEENLPRLLAPYQSPQSYQHSSLYSTDEQSR